MNTNIWRFLILAGMLTLFIAPNLTHSASSVDDALSINYLHISPQPVVAGDNVMITFDMFNSYVNTLNNVNLQITASTALLNVSPSSSYFVSAIGPGQYGGLIPEQFSFNLHVPSTLQAGEYTINIDASYYSTYGTSSSTEDEPGTSTMPINMYIYGKPDLQISAAPVGQIQPGGQSEFDLTTLNAGTDTADKVSITVLDSNSFTVYGSPILYAGTLAANKSSTSEIILQTASNLSAGLTSIPIMLNYTTASGTNVSENVSVPVSFIEGSPTIVASIQSALPQQLYAGGNQTLTIDIQNTGYSEAKNITMNFLSTSAIKVGSSDSTLFIGSLPEGTSTTAQVLITAANNANMSSYSLPVEVTYKNTANQNFSVVQNIPIKLQNSSIFSVTAVNSTPLQPGGSYQAVSLTIKNTGNEEADQVSLSLQTVYPLSPVDTNFYINKLMPGQSTTATFYVDVDSNGAPGTYPVTLYEQWRQPNGYTTQQYSGSNNYYAVVAQPTNGSGSSMEGLIIAVVVIIVVAIVGYRYYNTKMKGNSKGKHEKNKQ
ncbi:MAG: NEW3 domain-containing protein [Candidatus Marsarchaeota archaeon]|nr:NEW3 domain-containing protein [Candidatus Marsarchaeota archaeon]